MKNPISRIKWRITIILSHRPGLYAFIVGVGIVLFWRGVWHTVDNLHSYYNGYLSMDSVMSPWWDGPLSLVTSILILYFTGAFISSFIGNELILSGLRGEKKLTEKTESELQNETRAISDIKDSLVHISDKLSDLEKKVRDHHSS